MLDHRWNNFKRWFECMEKVKDEKPFVTMASLRKMIDYCDTTSNEIEEAVIKAFAGGTGNDSL